MARKPILSNCDKLTTLMIQKITSRRIDNCCSLKSGSYYSRQTESPELLLCQLKFLRLPAITEYYHELPIKFSGNCKKSPSLHLT